MADTFKFGEAGAEEVHRIGAECVQCWKGYPRPCAKCVGGHVHGAWGDEDAATGNYWLYTKCDTCGEAE